MRAGRRAGRGLAPAIAVIALAWPTAAWSQTPQQGPAQQGGKAPSADATREAGDRFQKGVAFYRDGEHQAALLEFKRAYELSPNYRVLYNLGQASRELKDHAGALTYFERYLSEGAGEIDARRRADVEAAIAELRPKVATLRVTTVPAGAEITIDDVPSGTSPLQAPLRVNAGRRKVSASMSGRIPVQRLVDVAGGDDSQVTLELVPVGSDTPNVKPDPAPAPEESEDGGGTAWPWIGLATTASLGVVTGVLGVRALGLQSDFEDQLDQQTDAATIEDARSDAEGAALVTDIFGGATILAAGATVLLFVLDGGDDERSAGATRLELRPTGVGVRGAF